MWPVIPNAILGFLMGVTLIFTLGDINSILATVTGQAFIQVFYNATQSCAAANTMTAVVVILLVPCCISEVATASRQIWSFCSRSWLAGFGLAITVLVSLVVSSLLTCINLGSSTALNVINSLGGVSILSSYLITISCLVWRRVAGPPLPPRRWSLGSFGLAINLASLLFLAPIWFFALWPLASPATAANMNWKSTMFGGTIIFVLIYYVVRARHQYEGPVIHVNREE